MKPAQGLAAALLAVAGAAHGHRPSDAFLTLAVHGSEVRGQWEIALRDVAMLVDADADRDGALTWGELRRSDPALQRVLMQSLDVAGDGEPCTVHPGGLQLNDRLDGTYAWVPLEVRCARAPAVLHLRYRLLFGLDPTHRGIVALTAPGASESTVFAPDRDAVTLRLDGGSALRLFLDYLREGVHHIWIGLDHVLFLVTLLLPCVLVRESHAWRGAPRLRPVLWDVARVVTAFTLAHSLTLGLAALGVLRLPAAPVESLIALSVAAAALNNVWPVVTRARSSMAFAFGLAHGFGFASVLGELGLPAGASVLSLAGFNAGVELGQLAIVAVALPPVFAARDTSAYRCALIGGSFAVAALALVWFGQRSGMLPI